MPLPKSIAIIRIKYVISVSYEMWEFKTIQLTGSEKWVKQTHFEIFWLNTPPVIILTCRNKKKLKTSCILTFFSDIAPFFLPRAKHIVV